MPNKNNHYALIKLPYELDSHQLFARIRRRRCPILLQNNAQQGYDLIVADPVTRLQTEGPVTHIYDASGSLSFSSDDCPLQLLREQLKKWTIPESQTTLNSPFIGGAVGYFGYDLARRWHSLENQANSDFALPEMDIGIYLWAIVRDHQQKSAYLIAHPECDALLLQDLIKDIQKETENTHPAFRLKSEICSTLDKTSYRKYFDQILEYIHAGHCYQINFAQRFDLEYEGDEWAAYRILAERTDAPFSAYLNCGHSHILSFSPERFLQVRDRQVQTKPIKGTRPRGTTPEQDQRYAQLLLNSVKDRAENLMIVDLLRNDLSKHCKLHSVHVEELHTIESYSNVHHLVSTVSGALEDGSDALDLLRDCFPGGSITGAPKYRAMQIIEELELSRRGIYCGSIGYVDFRGHMDTNIAIRTLLCQDQRLYCWGGGGIVADSEADSEFEESYIKVGNLMNTLRNIGISE